MSKLYFFALAALSCFSMMEAQDAKYYLRAINSIPIPEEYEEFFYTADGLTDSIHWCNTDYEGSVRFIYDENNNVVQRDQWQIIGFENKNTGYVVYKYDEDNKIILRHNFMDYGWGMSQQGTYEYIYDGDELVRRNTYIGAEWGEGVGIYEYILYEYDADGKLLSTVAYAPNMSGTLALSQVLVYTYDEQNRVSQVVTQLGDELDNLTDNQRTEYVYDANGNLESVTNYLANTGWRPASATYYFYDTNVSVDDVVYPSDIEDMFGSEVPEYSVNMVVRDSTCAEEGGSWGTYDVQTYTYENEPSVGIEESVVASDNADDMAVFVLGDRVYVYGLEAGAYVQVYDYSGRLVLSGRYTEGGIPVSLLPSGVKILKAGNFTGKFF